ncbi:MAG: winged helix-turn-helix transcriptional regulator [Rhizobiales bacterium]|nr:winged helix-turn-helix transcriptional regulator [Hyphomicrobiales bacterium]
MVDSGRNRVPIGGCAMKSPCPWRRITKDGHTLSTPDFLTAKVNTLARVLKRSSTKAYPDKFDISVTEWRTLAAIVQQQPCAASDLAIELGSDKALTGRVLKKLEQRKLISIDADPSDGRAVLIRTTTAGNSTYRQILPFAQERQANLLRVLSEAEREQLWTTLDRLIEYVSARLDESSDVEAGS